MAKKNGYSGKWEKKGILTGLTALLALAASLPVFGAGRWLQAADGRWWYQESGGGYPAAEWRWLDGDQDGFYECYYFDDEGYLCTGTTLPGGYLVNGDGAWVEDGLIQTRRTEFVGKDLTKQQQAQMAADSFAATRIRDGMTDFEKEMEILQFLLARTEYDGDTYEARRNGDWRSVIGNDAYTAYGALVRGLAVCEGYAEAFRMLGEASGLETVYVSGSANGRYGWDSHAWNLVRLDGEWYQVDPTFADGTAGEDHHLAIEEENVNMTSEQAERNHRWSGELPACTAETYGPYTVHYFLETGTVDTGKTEDQWKRYLMDQGNAWLVLSVSGTIAFEDGSNYADGPEDQDKVIRFLKDWFADSDHEEACVAYQKGSGTGWLTRDWLLGVMNTGGEKYKVIEYSWSDGAVSADYFLVARPKA